MNNSPALDLVQRAADLVLRSKHIVVLTGAGISTASGIPDFRSTGSGIWTKWNPMEVASFSAFRYRPEIFFAWLRQIAGHIVDAEPNIAHDCLARLERAGKIQAVITQNIDGLHQKAGSQEVIEVHGSMNQLICLTCRSVHPSGLYYREFIVEGVLPRCPTCRGLLKPDIVLFEEMLPVNAWERAVEHSQTADLFLVIGSSLEVTPAASLPLTAVRGGAKLIILTLSSTYLNRRADLVIPLDVTQSLPAITHRVLESLGGDNL